MFAVKTFLQLAGSMIANMRASQTAVTDFNVGGIARTMLEAPAAEIDELYQSYAAGLVEGIPTAIYTSFNFNPLPAMPASGILTITATAALTAPLVLPVGTLFSSSSGSQYATTQPVTVPVGGLVQVLAACTVAGETGNCIAGAVSNVVTQGLYVTVANALPFGNGQPIETAAQRKLRFAAYVASLARGTIASIEYIAGTAQIVDPTTGLVTERVTRVTVDESPGYVALYFWNGVGLVSAQLATQVANLIQGYTDPSSAAPVPGYRPTGMRVDSDVMTQQPLDVSLSVEVPLLQQTSDMQSAIIAAVGAAIMAVVSGATLSPLALQLAVLAVANVIEVQINSPTALVPCPISAVLVPGNITVSWL